MDTKIYQLFTPFDCLVSPPVSGNATRYRAVKAGEFYYQEGLMEFTIEELKFIKESLRYTLEKFQDYRDYPSLEFKMERVNYVQSLIDKTSKIIKDTRHGIPPSS